MYKDFNDKNILYTDEKKNIIRLPFYTPFVEQRKNVVRWALYSIKGPFELLHGDTAIIIFFNKSAIGPTKKRNFYNDVLEKRDINQVVRSQTDQECQPNII